MIGGIKNEDLRQKRTSQACPYNTSTQNDYALIPMPWVVHQNLPSIVCRICL